MIGDALAVNLTIMLVMTTIFTSKIEELPSTSDTKMIDIWLIGCLLVPFTEVVLRTFIEVLQSCDHCKALMEGETPSKQKHKNDKRTAWECFALEPSFVTAHETKTLDPPNVMALPVTSKKVSTRGYS